VQEATLEHPDTHLWRITQYIIQKYEMNVQRAVTVYKWAYETRFNKQYNPNADWKTEEDAPAFGGIFIADGRGNSREVPGVMEDALDQQNIRAESMRRAGLESLEPDGKSITVPIEDFHQGLRPIDKNEEFVL
jgi:hypothetical protein